jgi:RNA polymerase sigma-70 factor (ECF subfamily)
VSELTDDELMAMFRNGDLEAFDALFDRHYRSVYHFARMLLSDAHRAEDILQETFMGVLKASGRYQPRGHFRTWLMRICRNGCLNVLQRDRLRRSATLDGASQSAVPPTREPSAGERMQVKERMERVRQGISELPERQREAIVLYAYEQMSYREVAEVLEVPLGTVKTLIHRARATLAQELEHV